MIRDPPSCRFHFPPTDSVSLHPHLELYYSTLSVGTLSEILHSSAICRDHQAALVNTDWAAKHDRRNNPFISFPHNSLNGAVRFGAVEFCLSYSVFARHATLPDLLEAIQQSFPSSTQLGLVAVFCAYQPFLPLRTDPLRPRQRRRRAEVFEYLIGRLGSCAQDRRCHSRAGKPSWASGEQLSDVSQPYSRQRRL